MTTGTLGSIPKGDFLLGRAEQSGVCLGGGGGGFTNDWCIINFQNSVKVLNV